MRLIFLGDVVGRTGREAVSRELPRLKERYQPDLVGAPLPRQPDGSGNSVR